MGPLRLWRRLTAILVPEPGGRPGPRRAPPAPTPNADSTTARARVTASCSINDESFETKSPTMLCMVPEPLLAIQFPPLMGRQTTLDWNATQWLRKGFI